jgi:hypothetical protein
MIYFLRTAKQITFTVTTKEIFTHQSNVFKMPVGTGVKTLHAYTWKGKFMVKNNAERKNKHK